MMIVVSSTVPLVWYHTGTQDEVMQPEYDMRGGVRGKYYERYRLERPRARWRLILDYLTALSR